jgi:hypothetical protein
VTFSATVAGVGETDDAGVAVLVTAELVLVGVCVTQPAAAIAIASNKLAKRILFISPQFLCGLVLDQLYWQFTFQMFLVYLAWISGVFLLRCSKSDPTTNPN